MRKQYHFRSSNIGLYAWDVDRLVELTNNMQQKLTPVESIQELDEEFRFGGDIPTCRAIAEHAKLM